MSRAGPPLGPSVGVDIGGSKVLAVSLGAAGEIEAVDLPRARNFYGKTVHFPCLLDDHRRLFGALLGKRFDLVLLRSFSLIRGFGLVLLLCLRG